MRNKRIITILLLMAIIITSSTIAVLAYENTTIHTANNTLHMYGYKVWCNANISGTYDMTGIYTNRDKGNSSCCYVIPGTDNNHNLHAMYMYKGKEAVTVGTSGAYCGYGGTRGKLFMNLMGKQTTIYCD